MLLGCIGDDFTGSSDLANTLAKQGMRTVQYTGVPSSAAAADVEAGVVALKSRSVPVDQAVEQSLETLAWLQAQGCEQFFFKYCSTFDSTKEGNIGPVADALADALDAHQVIFCPAFPGTGRSIYQGHLFVNDILLNESGMENHPLTPMVDSDIRRWLGYQTKHSVGHVSASTVFAGSSSIKEALLVELDAGHRMVVVDALRDVDLLEIGKAVKNLPLITGGSGVALGLPGNFAEGGKITGGSQNWRGQAGKAIVLSGSCSKTTRAQVALHAKTNPTFEIVAADVLEGKLKPESVVDWLLENEGLPLAFSSAEPEVIKQVQGRFGLEKSAEALEGFFAELARQAVARGITRIITAGGETSGAVVAGLSLDVLEIGPEIDPGVPALRAGDHLVVALKSGNFGAPDFFAKADRLLQGNLDE